MKKKGLVPVVTDPTHLNLNSTWRGATLGTLGLSTSWQHNIFSLKHVTQTSTPLQASPGLLPMQLTPRGKERLFGMYREKGETYMYMLLRLCMLWFKGYFWMDRMKIAKFTFSSLTSLSSSSRGIIEMSSMR